VPNGAANLNTGINRRTALKSIVATSLVGSRGLHAANYPSRPVTLILPWTPGGATDALIRQLAVSAGPILQQSVVIENRPGAGGTLGPAHMAATAKPDGYTVAQVATSLLRLPHLQQTTYNPLTDFTYIIGLSAWSTGAVVRNDAPWKSWKEFVAYARANPEKVTYCTSGIGSSLHIYMERIARAEGIKLLHVPYKGAAEMNIALSRGDVHMIAADLGGAASLLDSGKAKLLVTWGAQRAARWPDVPTLREQGLDIVAITPFGLAGPKGMDPAVVQVLHDAFNQARKDPAYKSLSERLAFEDYYQSPKDFEKWAKVTFEEEGKILNALGLARKS